MVYTKASALDGEKIPFNIIKKTHFGYLQLCTQQNC
jgi:hypothetical protein